MIRSLPLFVTLFSACAVTPTDVDTEDTADDGKADGLARPAGVYSRTEATDGQLLELMLLPDRTFLRYEASGD